MNDFKGIGKPTTNEIINGIGFCSKMHGISDRVVLENLPKLHGK